MSVPEKVKVTDVDVLLPPLDTAIALPSVAESIVVSGGVASTLQLNDASDVASFPTLSTDLTFSV